MKQTSESAMKVKIVNFFGSLGYAFCFMQWLWAVLLYFSVIQPAISFMRPEAAEKVYDVPSVSVPGPVETVFIAVVVVLMIAVTVYALFKLPGSIVKTSSKIAYKTTVTAVPVAMKVQHKKDTKKNRLMLTPKVLMAVKLLLVIIPTIFTVASTLLNAMPIDYLIAVVVGGVLTCVAILLFVVQYILSLVLHVKLVQLK